ncbi:MAG: tyrosine recombinase XerC [Vulcanimicrobiaceae bacterium]
MKIRARGEGTIYRRKDGMFEGKLSLRAPDGSPVRKSFYGRSRSEVAARMRQYGVQHGNAAEPPRVTLAAYLESYLEASDVRPNTFRLRAHFIRRHIVPHIGSRLLGALTSDDVRLLLRRWEEENVGAVTRRSAFVTLSSALNIALREEKILRNPCGTVRTPKIKRAEVDILDGSQAMQLLAAARDLHERALLSLAITTGMRQGEIFALWWEDVDLDAGRLSVKKTLTEDLQGRLIRSDPKTTKSRRIIHLPNLALHALRDLKSARDANAGFVFTSNDGGAFHRSNFTKRVFKPLLERAGLPDVTFHSLRHTANSLLIEAGEDPLAIAGSLGHADTRMMFERYGHLFDHTARRVADTANRIFDRLEADRRKTGH